MMYRFLANNRDVLIARCKLKVEQRPTRAATVAQLQTGVPIFIDQLQRTLAAEEDGQAGTSLAISGKSGGDVHAQSEIGVSAAAHGKALLDLGYTVDQVVHDYGDVCQAITDLAFERDAPFGVDEFRTLNRCLDNAIADAVTAFSLHRDELIAHARDAITDRRAGFFVHELRTALSTAHLATSALEHGNLPISGATGGVLKRSLANMTGLINSEVAGLRRSSKGIPNTVFSVAEFVAHAVGAAELFATTKGCTVTTIPVDATLQLSGNRGHLLAALGNLLHNACKYTHAGTEIVLGAYAMGPRLRIDVRDHCGGLPHGDVDTLFAPFVQIGTDRSGLGLGLSIARMKVETDGGTLTARDDPGKGCTFTIDLPLHTAA